MHSEEKCERGDRVHAVDEGEHQRERDRAAEAGKDPDDEADADAKEQQSRVRPLQDREQAAEKDFDVSLRPVGRMV
jgi:hypothetical protein